MSTTTFICDACSGTGFIDVDSGESFPCGACSGRGKYRTTIAAPPGKPAAPPEPRRSTAPKLKPDQKHAFKATKATSRALAKAAAMPPASLKRQTSDATMHFRLKGKTKAKLQAKADELGFTMSELIVELVERFLK